MPLYEKRTKNESLHLLLNVLFVHVVFLHVFNVLKILKGYAKTIFFT